MSISSGIEPIVPEPTKEVVENPTEADAQSPPMESPSEAPVTSAENSTEATPAPSAENTENPTVASDAESQTKTDIPPTGTETETVTTKESTEVLTETEKPKDAVLEIMLQRIQPLKSNKPNTKLMIYGPPGGGKSTFLAGIPNNIIVDTENGTNVPSRFIAENVARLPYKTFLGLEKQIQKFAEAPEALNAWTTISVDTVSALHKRGLAEVLLREHNKSPSMVNRYKAETDHHTENNEHIRQLIDALCQLPKNIVITAHARTVEPKQAPDKTYADFSDKLANTLAGMMDVYAYMEEREFEGATHRFMRFHSDGTIQAKARGNWPDEIMDPTWADIQKILDEEF